MYKCVSLFLLAASVNAYAAPPSSEDEMNRFLHERGLFTKLEQVGNTALDRAVAARDRASELVFNAMGFLGVPYRRGGNSVETGGFDCSGFVRAMYEQTVGLLLPRRAKEQAAATITIDRQDLKPGDLVFFNTMRNAFSHVGIYVGDNKFIHSPKPGAQVRVEDMGMSYWARRFNGARRVTVAQEQVSAN